MKYIQLTYLLITIMPCSFQPVIPKILKIHPENLKCGYSSHWIHNDRKLTNKLKLSVLDYLPTNSKPFEF